MDNNIQPPQENPSLLNNINIKLENPPRTQHAGGGGDGGGGGGGGRGGSGDRMIKRDEWSEGAVCSLLEAYEAKWTLRNRAKLKGQDWEDVARHVSCRSNSTKSPKTQTQCKNKIESMKKRYRSESAAVEPSSWPLYNRLDLLLRGNGPSPPPVAAESLAATAVEPPPPQLPPAPPPALVVGNTAQNSTDSTGVERLAKDDGDGTKLPDHLSDQKNVLSTDSSTPAINSGDGKMKASNWKRRIGTKKRKRDEHCNNIAESIRWLGEVVLRTEQSRMDTLRELEKMRAEAEARRGEMELKRIEIIANTQLEIAKLFAAHSNIRS